MSPDEYEILQFLKEAKDFVSPKEVSRRVGGKKKYFKNPTWAKPLLIRLTNAGHAEINEIGHFRCKPENELRSQSGSKPKKRMSVSPHIARIFEDSGKIFLLDEVPQETETPPPDDSAPLAKDGPATS